MAGAVTGEGTGEGEGYGCARFFGPLSVMVMVVVMVFRAQGMYVMFSLSEGTAACTEYIAVVPTTACVCLRAAVVCTAVNSNSSSSSVHLSPCWRA